MTPEGGELTTSRKPLAPVDEPSCSDSYQKAYEDAHYHGAGGRTTLLRNGANALAGGDPEVGRCANPSYVAGDGQSDEGYKEECRD